MCDVPERLRNRAAPSMANPAINRSAASPNGSVESEPVAANDKSAGVGAAGVVAGATGVTGLDAAEAVPVPMAFVAVTVNV